MSESKESIEGRTDEAFERSAWRDPRADYRALLRQLREQDAALFESAVVEYETRVAGRLADAAVDPVAAWLDYGRRLAELAGRGRTIRIDETGVSVGDDPADPSPALLIHLPADEGAAAIVIAEPRDASSAQRATIALLAERRSSLPS